MLYELRYEGYSYVYIKIVLLPFYDYSNISATVG